MTSQERNQVPRVSGGLAEHGHLEEFRTDPIGLMQRVRVECGEVGIFQLAGKKEYGFEMAQPSESYRNDHSKMVVQLAQPAKVRYRRR